MDSVIQPWDNGDQIALQVHKCKYAVNGTEYNQVICVILKLCKGNFPVVMLTMSTPQNLQPGLVFFFLREGIQADPRVFSEQHALFHIFFKRQAQLCRIFLVPDHISAR